MGIYEIMAINDEIRKLINEQASTNVIKAAAKRHGMNTLRESGIKAVYDGLTTIHEVVRETMSL